MPHSAAFAHIGLPDVPLSTPPRLRILWGSPCGGSSPPFRTNNLALLSKLREFHRSAHVQHEARKTGHFEPFSTGLEKWSNCPFLIGGGNTTRRADQFRCRSADIPLSSAPSPTPTDHSPRPLATTWRYSTWDQYARRQKSRPHDWQRKRVSRMVNATMIKTRPTHTGARSRPAMRTIIPPVVKLLNSMRSVLKQNGHWMTPGCA
jgi:hypothetical protein